MYSEFIKVQVFKNILALLSILLLFGGCEAYFNKSANQPSRLSVNILDYSYTPSSIKDKEGLMFSDQGAWFAYSFPTKSKYFGGFSGPFLLTEQNGVWSSEVLSQLKLYTIDNKEIPYTDFTSIVNSYNSHLEQIFESKTINIRQRLYYHSAHTAFIKTEIRNVSEKEMVLTPTWCGNSMLKSLNFEQNSNAIVISSSKSAAIGLIQALGEDSIRIQNSDSTYLMELKPISIGPSEIVTLMFSQTFIFPEYDLNAELQSIEKSFPEFESGLITRIISKEEQMSKLASALDTNWVDTIYGDLLSKTVLSLQNNWRVGAGELKHAGLFPSYHYKWFNGFWAWDSWKHSAALAYYNTDLAKDQIRAMYDFMDNEGFIADCIYRDTTIENHNYRNTKPPLSAWAVMKIFEEDKDLDFLAEVYPKIKMQHYWWYENRDNDKDGLCEYGSTDGSVIAAKWESGMDNAVRFDNSEILKNSETAWSLNQESVDLNSYLYAEKNYLGNIANELGYTEDAEKLNLDAATLKLKIQKQFFDKESGWFYDTSIDGEEFIKVMGCEGWIPLWAKVATDNQAEVVKRNMMNPGLFYTKLPFQTLSADHPKFEPDGGYWRGPNWLDQSYFGVRGLHNYGYHNEAYDATYKLIHNAEGLLGNGQSIRENYNPISGQGLESKNFSWSAAHYMLLLINE